MPCILALIQFDLNAGSMVAPLTDKRAMHTSGHASFVPDVTVDFDGNLSRHGSGGLFPAVPIGTEAVQPHVICQCSSRYTTPSIATALKRRNTTTAAAATR